MLKGKLALNVCHDYWRKAKVLFIDYTHNRTNGMIFFILCINESVAMSYEAFPA